MTLDCISFTAKSCCTVLVHYISSALLVVYIVDSISGAPDTFPILHCIESGAHGRGVCPEPGSDCGQQGHARLGSLLVQAITGIQQYYRMWRLSCSPSDVLC